MVYYSFLYFLSKKEYVDTYYYKFCGEGQHLILGLSRAQNGMVPSVINQTLFGEKSNDSIINFAFEKSQSPFGEIYSNAIRNKIKNSDKRGIYIISVSPGNFLAKKDTDEEGVLKRDKKLMMLGKVDDVTSNPNFSYLTNFYGSSTYNVFLNNNKKNKTSNKIVHRNGWMEFKLKSPSYDVTPQDLASWKSETIIGYKSVMEKEEISEYRMESFKQLMNFLSLKGDVFLVRMPISEEVYNLENTNWLNFSEEMSSLSKNLNVTYLDYSKNFDFITYDGSHLVSESAVLFTKMLSKDIKKHINCE